MTGAWQPSDLVLVLAGFFALCCLASLVFVLLRMWATR